MAQQGDVILFQTLDNGEIEVSDGLVSMDGGLGTMAYLCLFGGNVEDDGQEGTQLIWWGNLIEQIPARRYVSRTQKILETYPLTTGNLQKFENAAYADLQVFLDEKICSELTVVATIPSINRVNFAVTINAFGNESTFNFTENWISTLGQVQIDSGGIVPPPLTAILVDGDGNFLVDGDANKLTESYNP